jgi:hypothetical protein
MSKRLPFYGMLSKKRLGTSDSCEMMFDLSQMIVAQEV